MRNKTDFLLFFCLLLAATLSAQMKNSGVQIRISAGTYFVLNDNFANLSGGKLDNNGHFQCRSLSNNSGATLTGAGRYTVKKNWTNAGAFSGSSTVVFSLSETASITPGGVAFYKVELKKTGSGVNVNLLGSMQVNSNLKFAGTGNHLQLGNYNLTLGTAATITAASSTQYVITNASGKLLKVNAGAAAFLFPVGYDAATYNPLTIAHSATTTVSGVRCLASPLSGGGTGTGLPFHVVNASWEVSQVSSGLPSLTLTAQWASTDELLAFNRNSCAIRRFNGTAWDSSPFGAATGPVTGPYSRSRSGINAVGYFAVLDDLAAFGGNEDRATASTTPLSAADLPAQESLQLFPNPATDYLHLQRSGQGTAQARILDVQGKVMLEEVLTEPLSRLDVATLPAGAYFVEVLSATQPRQVKKFLKLGF